MNCKPGDLAVGVYPEIFAGRFCTVLRQAPVPYTDSCGHYNGPNDAMLPKWGPIWIVNWACAFPGGPNGRVYHLDCLIYDAFIKPIRDNPGNEAWVTEASKKLKPTEITERGELA